MGPPAQPELARALGLKAWALLYLGDAETALSLSQQAVALNAEPEGGSRSELGYNLRVLGAVYCSLGRYDQANDYFEQSLTLSRELGNWLGQRHLLIDLGELARMRGDYHTAIARYQEARAISLEVGDRRPDVVFLNNRGGARVGLGEYGAAEADLRQVIHTVGTAGWSGLSETYRFLAEALLGQGRIDEALAAARQALVLALEIEDKPLVGAAWRVLGTVAAQRLAPISVEVEPNGESPRHDATACFAESLRIFEEMGAEGERARTLRAWAAYELERGDLAHGEAMWQQARGIFERLGMMREVERMDSRAAQISENGMARTRQDHYAARSPHASPLS